MATSIRPRKAAVVVAVGTLLASMTLAACGSSDDSGRGSGKGDVSADALAAASEAAAAAAEPPSQIAEDLTPLEEAPNGAKTVAYLQCVNVEACKVIGDGIVRATEAVGWNSKIINFDNSSPASLGTSLKTALQFDPDVTIFSASNYAAWKSVIPAYKEAGAKLLPVGAGDDVIVDETVLQPVQGHMTNEAAGKILADWVIADSEGDAEALMVTVPAYEGLKVIGDTFADELTTACASCLTVPVEATPEQLGAGAITQLSVAKLQKNPKANYLIASFSALVPGIGNALSTAGFSGKVKVAAYEYNPTSLADIRAGRQHAAVAQGYGYLGWQAVDVILRSEQGMEIPASDALLPLQLITKDNIDQLKDDGPYEPPFDYASQFKTIWKVS